LENTRKYVGIQMALIEHDAAFLYYTRQDAGLGSARPNGANPTFTTVSNPTNFFGLLLLLPETHPYIYPSECYRNALPDRKM